MKSAVLLVISTFPEVEVARRVARELVEARLVACANIMGPVESIYRWKGEIETAPEITVFFKLPAERYDQFERRLREMHPYDVPEIITVEITGGTPTYLTWVRDSCDVRD